MQVLDLNEVVDVHYGISEEGMSHGENDAGVVIPESTFSMSAALQELLITSINPMEHSTDYGIDIYERTRALLS
jgi:hypothetical protein